MLGADEANIQLQSGMQLKQATVAGTVSATGTPLAVMDIAAAQDFFGKQGHLSRIDLQLPKSSMRDELEQLHPLRRQMPARPLRRAEIAGRAQRSCAPGG